MNFPPKLSDVVPLSLSLSLFSLSTSLALYQSTTLITKESYLDTLSSVYLLTAVIFLLMKFFNGR